MIRDDATRAGARCAPGLLWILVLVGLAGTPLPAAAESDADLARQASQIFGTLPDEATSPEHPITEAKIALGRTLYYDARLSKSRTISCNSCHRLDQFGVDHEPTSPGHEGQRGERNSPTVYNAALHLAQFWDGRAADVEEQAKGPVLNPIEMAMPGEAEVVRTLESIAGYAPMFAAAFPDAAEPISYDHMAEAIGAFERRLITPSRFDDFVAGDPQALSEAERAGLDLFMQVGCVTCHMGPAIGGSIYQKLGLVKPYVTGDLGRFEATGREADKYFFKVPSLRNVAQTAPYFHDGSVATLPEAVRLMARHQLGRELDRGQTELIVTFLETLTGRVDEQYVAEPELPASGPDTPAPDPS